MQNTGILQPADRQPREIPAKSGDLHILEKLSKTFKNSSPGVASTRGVRNNEPTGTQTRKLENKLNCGPVVADNTARAVKPN